MNFLGFLKDISKDWKSDKWQVTFVIDTQEDVKKLATLEQNRLRVKVDRYRRKRSLDSNAYAWVLMTKIAEAIDSSKEEVYEEMLQKYGYLYQDDDGYITVTVKSSVDMSKIEGHWKQYKSNGQFTSYLMIKGSSEYDTKEMAHFLDMVVDEAKGLGIETMPPDELQRMMDMWGKK